MSTVTLKLGKGIVRSFDITDIGFPDDLPQIAVRVVAHALKSKLGDAHADITKKDNPGNFMELSNREIDRVWSGLVAGNWNTRGEALDAEDILNSMTDEMLEAYLAKRRAA